MQIRRVEKAREESKKRWVYLYKYFCNRDGIGKFLILELDIILFIKIKVNVNIKWEIFFFINDQE